MLDNAAIAELLIREAETATGHRERALQRAAHAAFMWSEEAVDLVTAGRSLTELAGIGPSLAKRLHGWARCTSSVRKSAGAPRIPDAGAGAQSSREKSTMAGTAER